MLLKIAIIGPESTGKTELAKALAEHFGVSWFPEYAREYVENLDRPYNFDDICNIAHRQIEQEISTVTIENENYVFFDTDLIITKVWFEFCYNIVPDFVTERLKTRFFDLYLLSDTDLQWQPDPVREHGNDREYFMEWYKREIEQIGTPYVIVNGQGKQRYEHAIDAVISFTKQMKTF